MTCTWNNSRIVQLEIPLFYLFYWERREKEIFDLSKWGVFIVVVVFFFFFFFMKLDLKQRLEEFWWRAFRKSCPFYSAILESWDSMSGRHKRRNFMVWFLKAFAYCSFLFCFVLFVYLLCMKKCGCWIFLMFQNFMKVLKMLCFYWFWKFLFLLWVER